jgi:sugar transferase EpsL
MDRSLALAIKRAMDVVLSAAALLVLSPFILVIALLVRVFMGSPVFFRQARPGHKCKLFTLVKFRTMREAHGPDGKPLSGAERVTPLGKFLRVTSLDEIPNLWNVLCGQMSLVGPRPQLPEFLSHYTPDQIRRHDMKPGITGWAQVNGRHAIPFAQRFELDLWYVDNWSLALDIKILWLTAWHVLGARGAVPVEEEIDFSNLDGKPRTERAPRQAPPGRKQRQKKAA